MDLEENIPNFTILLRRYNKLYKYLKEYPSEVRELYRYELTKEDYEALSKEDRLVDRFKLFDKHFKLAIGAKRIAFNAEYFPKLGFERFEHIQLILYKLDNLWKAYNACLSIYQSLNNQAVEIFDWLANLDFNKFPEIQGALKTTNTKLNTIIYPDLALFWKIKFKNFFENYKPIQPDDEVNDFVLNVLKGITNKITAVAPNVIKDLTLIEFICLYRSIRNEDKLRIDSNKLLTIIYELMGIVILCLMIGIIEEKPWPYKI